jgi:hypothetical protein
MTHSTIIAVPLGEGLSPGNNTLYSSPLRAVSERVQGIYLEGFTATLSISHKGENDILGCCATSKLLQILNL